MDLENGLLEKNNIPYKNCAINAIKLVQLE